MSLNKAERETMFRLVAALEFALDEIHHPGAALSRNIDITKMCGALIKEGARIVAPNLTRSAIKEIVREAQP